MVVFAAVLAGCAARPEKIAPAYVSSMQYQPYDCKALRAETDRVVTRLNSLSGVQNKKATTDAILTGTAIVLFWPAAFFASGVSGSDSEAEIGNLKGQAEALQATYRAKGCGL
jgi:hypothetical protein